MKLAKHTGDQPNISLENQIALLQRKERHLTIINNFVTSLLLQNTIEEIVWSITTNVIAKLGFVDCVVYLLDQDRKVLVQSGYGTTFSFSLPVSAS